MIYFSIKNNTDNDIPNTILQPRWWHSWIELLSRYRMNIVSIWLTSFKSSTRNVVRYCLTIHLYTSFTSFSSLCCKLHIFIIFILSVLSQIDKSITCIEYLLVLNFQLKLSTHEYYFIKKKISCFGLNMH